MSIRTWQYKYYKRFVLIMNILTIPIWLPLGILFYIGEGAAYLEDLTQRINGLIADKLTNKYYPFKR